MGRKRDSTTATPKGSGHLQDTSAPLHTQELTEAYLEMEGRLRLKQECMLKKHKIWLLPSFVEFPLPLINPLRRLKGEVRRGSHGKTWHGWQKDSPNQQYLMQKRVQQNVKMEFRFAPPHVPDLFHYSTAGNWQSLRAGLGGKALGSSLKLGSVQFAQPSMKALGYRHSSLKLNQLMENGPDKSSDVSIWQVPARNTFESQWSGLEQPLLWKRRKYSWPSINRDSTAMDPAKNWKNPQKYFEHA